jgi:hypothetical protein
MYSVVSASVLGFDLSRLPGGASVAAVLRGALALGPADLQVLLRAAGDVDRRAVARAGALDAARRLVRTPDAMAAVSAGLADDARRRVALGLLEQAALGHVDALVRLVRDDLLAWARAGSGQDARSGPAVAVVADAAVAAYTSGLVDRAVAEVLAGPWAAARPSLPAPATDAGPCRERVDALLGRAARLDGSDLERLSVAADAVRADTGAQRAGEWAPAMHSATWAVHLAERLQPAAVAQLRLVEALHGSVPVERLARGCWSTLSGAVQAEVVADLLDPETYDVLAGGTLLALGLPG